MNVGRSIKVALAQRDKNLTWLKERLGVSKARTCAMANSKNLHVENIEKLAAIFKLPPSEFIALGEKDIQSE